MRKLKTKITMLETYDDYPNCLILKDSNGNVRIPVAGGEFRRLTMSSHRTFKKYHLYFTLPSVNCSKGDMTIHPEHGLVIVTNVFPNGYNVTKPEWYKENPEKGEWWLGLPDYIGKLVASSDFKLNLPQVSSDFLNKFAILNGIDMVLLEYDENNAPITTYDYLMCREYIRISGVKNMWNKRELIEALKKFHIEGKSIEESEIEDWVENNCI